MPRTLSPEETRSVVIDHVERMEALPTFGKPSPELYERFGRALAINRQGAYTTSRGKRQISVHLDMTVSNLESMLVGKSMLDVGCGDGVFSSEAARSKKTKVTAVDNDPEQLARVKESKNLKTIQGSGYNLKEAVGDEKYDVIVVSHSSLFWAANEEQKRAAITSPLGVCAAGGIVLFVPVISDPQQREFARKELESAKARGETERYISPTITASTEDLLAGVYVPDWLDVVAVDTLLQKEGTGEIDLTFVSSRSNALNLRVNQGQDPVLQRYSAIARLLD